MVSTINLSLYDVNAKLAPFPNTVFTPLCILSLDLPSINHQQPLWWWAQGKDLLEAELISQIHFADLFVV